MTQESAGRLVELVALLMVLAGACIEGARAIHPPADRTALPVIPVTLTPDTSR